MTTLGLRCMLENILDEHPHLSNENIEKIEIIEVNKKNHLQIIYANGETINIKLFENAED